MNETKAAENLHSCENPRDTRYCVPLNMFKSCAILRLISGRPTYVTTTEISTLLSRYCRFKRKLMSRMSLRFRSKGIPMLDFSYFDSIRERLSFYPAHEYRTKLGSCAQTVERQREPVMDEDYAQSRQ